MAYVAHITEVATGRTVAKRFEDEYNHYMWEEGNYSCDGNRRQFFEQALGMPETEHVCSEGLFTVEIQQFVPITFKGMN